MALTTDETKFLDTLTTKGLSDPKKLRYALDKFRERSTFEAKPGTLSEGISEGATGGIKQMAKDYGTKVQESPLKEGFLAVPKLALAAGKQVAGAGKDLLSEVAETPGKLYKGGKYLGKGLYDLATEGELSDETIALGKEVEQGTAETMKRSANIASTVAAPFNPALSGVAQGFVPYASRQEQGIDAGKTKSGELGQVAGEVLTGGLLGKASDIGIKKTTGRTPLELADATPQAVKNVASGVKEVADVGVAKVGSVVEPVIQTGVDVVKKTYTPERALQSTNKMTKKQIIDFTSINKGKTPSEWLIERDLIDTPENTVESLVARADEAKKILDESLSKVEGTYKTPELLSVPIQELREQFTKTRPFGGEDVTAINSYAKKVESGEGLTLSEVNNLKRIYERNVKVNYLKDNNAIGIDRANEIDSNLRNFVRDEGAKAGVPAVARLSNEIQSSHSLANNIANWVEGSASNNLVSLTDYILLGGSVADVKTGFALSFGKKLLSQPKLKVWFVKSATKGDAKAMKELPGVPTEIINIKNAERRAFEFQKWASENRLYSFIGEDAPKALPEGKTIQAAKPDLDTMSEVYRQGEMVQDVLTEADKVKPKTDFKKAGTAESALLEEAKKYIDDAKKEQGTLIIDSDKVKERMAGYTPEKAPEFHEESSKIAEQAFKDALKDPEYSSVEFMAGGSGSGKSEVYVNANKNKPDTILYDGTFADGVKARKKLEQALSSGKNVSIKAIYAPIEDAWKFASLRDRVVPKDVFIEKHTGFRNTVADLAKEYPNLKVDVYLNRLGKKAAKLEFSSRQALLDHLDNQRLLESEVAGFLR
jgi:hypothetical protein